jgi:hypothetical protein|nr:MAG TPA: hypothetical protein [Caudoviricetes sp.]
MTYDDFKELIKERQRDEGANLSVKYVEYVYDKLSPAYQKRVLFSVRILKTREQRFSCT